MSIAADALRQKKSEISSEDELQEYLKWGMESNGWTVIREAKPRNSDYKADIIAGREDIGWIGIECKYVTGGPVVAGKAARQVFDKYADEKFINRKISAWGVCLYGHRFSEPNRVDFDEEHHYENAYNAYRHNVETTKRIMNGLGLGWTTVSQDRVFLEFLPSGSDLKVPLFKIGSDFRSKYSDETDMKRIEELATDRRP